MDDIEMIIDSGNDGVCYIESLARSARYLTEFLPELLPKLSEVITAELDLALLSAEKARSELLKSNKEATVRPIK